jgi:hypothetical protein
MSCWSLGFVNGARSPPKFEKPLILNQHPKQHQRLAKRRGFSPVA